MNALYSRPIRPMRSIVVLFLSLSGCGWLRIGGCCGGRVRYFGGVRVRSGCHLNLHSG